MYFKIKINKKKIFSLRVDSQPSMEGRGTDSLWPRGKIVQKKFKQFYLWFNNDRFSSGSFGPEMIQMMLSAYGRGVRVHGAW